VSIYDHIPHPRVAARREEGPVKVADQLPAGNAAARFNAKFALLITRAVGSMWCAYAFGAFDLISLPDAIRTGTAAIISWIAQTFLQLVLLSVIMVGQNLQAAGADKRAEQTFLDAEAVLAEASKIQEHLKAQDEVLTNLVLAQSAKRPPPRRL